MVILILRKSIRALLDRLPQCHLQVCQGLPDTELFTHTVFDVLYHRMQFVRGPQWDVCLLALTVLVP